MPGRAAPLGAAGEELRPGHADEEDGRVAQRAEQVLHEVEAILLAPMEVLEGEDHRVLLGVDLEEATEHGPADELELRRVDLDGLGEGRVEELEVEVGTEEVQGTR